MEELKLFAQYGVSAVFAVAMFLIYRQDRKTSEERYEKLAVEFRTIVQDNTKAITSNTDAIESLKDALDRQ